MINAYYKPTCQEYLNFWWSFQKVFTIYKVGCLYFLTTLIIIWQEFINLALTKEWSHFSCLVDFPSDIANKSLSESSATVLWKSKGRRRRASHPTAESSSEQGASEADIDSDSGYCSPKHSNNQPAMGASRTDSGPMNVCTIALISLSVICVSIILVTSAKV